MPRSDPGLPWHRESNHLPSEGWYRGLSLAARGVYHGLKCLAGRSPRLGFVEGPIVARGGQRGSVADRLAADAYAFRRGLLELLAADVVRPHDDRGLIVGQSWIDPGSIVGQSWTWLEVMHFTEDTPPSLSSRERTRKWREEKALRETSAEPSTPPPRDDVTSPVTSQERHRDGADRDRDGDRDPPSAPPAGGPIPSEPPSPPDPNAPWPRARALLEQRMTGKAFLDWIAPLRQLAVHDDTLHVEVPNLLHGAWVEQNFTAAIEDVLTELGDVPRRFRLVAPEAPGLLGRGRVERPREPPRRRRRRRV